MTRAQLEIISNQAVAACAVLYFLAFLAQLGSTASRRSITAEPGTTLTQGRPSVLRVTSSVAVAPAPAGTRDGAGSSSHLMRRTAVTLTAFAALVQFLALVTRGVAADPARVPWGNMYEFTLAATFVVVALYLAMYRRFALAWLAPVVLLFVLSVLMIDVLVLYEPVTPLRDALQSPWLVIHVIAAILATGAFTMGGMCSALYLLKARAERHGVARTGYLAAVPSLRDLDRLSYRWHAFAFPIWTFAALIAGPIWAQYAWGRYWGWDPKEVWAFITWVVYAGYLHARATAGWKGKRAALVGLLGLATLWFNFIGINFFFGSGSQHSYAVELLTRTVSAG